MMKKNRALIVTPFFNYSYDVRIKYVEKYFINNKYETSIISSNFDHRTKNEYKNDKSNLTLIEVPKYSRNISFKRIYSHYSFAKSCINFAKEYKPNIIYISGPPNFLFYYFSKFKKRNDHVKIIYEIGDMWPETMPINKKIKTVLFPFFFVWSSLRNYSFKYADGIIYECKLFEKQMKKYQGSSNSQIIYLCKTDNSSKDINIDIRYQNTLGFCYIGSINNIVDIDTIIKILCGVKEKNSIFFHIIGIGEKTQLMLQKCKSNGIPYKYYGAIYDDSDKLEIINNSQFAFNTMKKTVVVGATMKSLEYFYWGQIVLNNIPYDTNELINEYEAGFNINSIENVVNKINSLTSDEIIKIRYNSIKLYNDKFNL